MQFYLVVLFSLLLIIFVAQKNYKNQLFLILLSLIGNMFFFDFNGTRILLSHVLVIITFPFYKSSNFSFLNKLIRGIRLEYLILFCLGLLYGFLLPWEDESSLRSWSQQAGGRTIVALIRILIEILVIYYIYFIFKTGKVSEFYLIKIISILIISLSFFSFIDFAFNHQIWKFMFLNSSYFPALENRFLGWSHEPRSFGRLMLVPWFIILIYKNNGFYIRHSNLALILGFICVVSSLSFSTYLIFLLGLIILATFKFRLNSLARSILSSIIFIIIISSAYFIINKTDYFQSGLVSRYQLLTEGKADFQMYNEPYIFTSFEVFDRAALNFFYNNTNHIFLGTGPNLIGIPSSIYLDESASISFNDTLIGIPGIGLINHISRAGIIGLLLYLLSFFKILNYLKKSGNKNIKEVFTVTSILYLVVSNPWIYLIIGFVLAQSELILNKNIFKNKS